jgi:hypothetical protein
MPRSHENTKVHKEIFSSRDESIERIARHVVDAAFNVINIEDGIRRYVL